MAGVTCATEAAIGRLMAVEEGPPCPLGKRSKPCGTIVREPPSTTYHCNGCYKRWSEHDVRVIERAMRQKRAAPKPSPEVQVRLPE